MFIWHHDVSLSDSETEYENGWKSWKIRWEWGGKWNGRRRRVSRNGLIMEKRRFLSQGRGRLERHLWFGNVWGQKMYLLWRSTLLSSRIWSTCLIRQRMRRIFCFGCPLSPENRWKSTKRFFFCRDTGNAAGGTGVYGYQWSESGGGDSRDDCPSV